MIIVYFYCIYHKTCVILEVDLSYIEAQSSKNRCCFMSLKVE